MKRSRFTETQIISILKEADAGLAVKAVCRKHGISDATFYNWKRTGPGINSNSRLPGFQILVPVMSEGNKSGVH